MALHFASRAPRRVGVGGFWSAAVDQTSAIRTRLDVFRLLCLELGTDFGGNSRPSYAVAPSVSSEATTARGEQAGRRNPKAATVAHRGPPRDSD